MSQPERKWRIAWLHRANDNYYTDEQVSAADFPLDRNILERCYFQFIERAAVDELKTKLQQAKSIANERHDSINALEREVGRLKLENTNLEYERNMQTSTLQEKFQQAEAEIERLKASLNALTDALKMYAALKGKAIHWPDRDYCSYLETPAIEALAKANKIREKK